MLLKNVEFKRIWNASGARNFYGDGWWFHRFARHLGLDWNDSTLVSKTTTFEPRDGNLPLLGNLQPKEYNPKCIKVNFRKGAVLNAVGLSGPGFEALLRSGYWQALKDPFFLSFMAVDSTEHERLEKTKMFTEKLHQTMHGFQVPIGLQVNFSCPNVGLNPEHLIKEVHKSLDILSHLSIPLVLKFNALLPIEAAKESVSHNACSAITVSNTIPWGKLPDRIDWTALFGKESPLKDIGGGGLSGSPILPIVKDWIEQAMPLPKPLIASGGILSAEDALSLVRAGASAVELGSVAILRPWRVAGIIKSVNNFCGEK